MSRNKVRKTPYWISEYIPKELVESTLFRFNVELQTVLSFKCVNCDAEFNNNIKVCSECGGVLDRKHKKVTVDLVPDVDLDYEILDGQLQTLPAQYTFYSAVYSELKLKVAIEERRLKAVKGQIIERLKNQMRENNVKLTGEQLKSIMEADDQIIKADYRLQLAQMQCGKLYHILEALKMKSEIGRSLLALKREISKGDYNAI